MNRKTRHIIGFSGSLIICLYGIYRLVIEMPAPVQSLIIPIAFAVSGFIGAVGNAVELRKLRQHN